MLQYDKALGCTQMQADEGPMGSRQGGAAWPWSAIFAA
jgi:hypothetical protein